MEGYLMWNFCMDLLVCAACALACGRDRLWPCLPAAVLGAAYALAAAKWTRLGGLPCAALVGASMAAISARPETLAMAARAVCALCAAGLFAGGAQLLVLQQTGHASAGALAAAACALGLDLWLVRSRRVRLATWNVQLILRTGAGVARFRALVDTGNRLHEPISGLPVMIVEEKALRGALPEDFDARRAADRLPPGWRLVSYGVLGSAGRMACFRPGRLMV
ncbi:MAG: sigma-E processing peptidase SpoIIGA, partial [Eubacteriales bacterium]|nr:sigma-E processing peptidase SpoIIGA [Eubacteriales bacterium]